MITRDILDIVNEARIDKYMSMYPAKLIRSLTSSDTRMADSENAFKFYLKWAISKLKREDRIIWYMRWAIMRTLTSYMSEEDYIKFPKVIDFGKKCGIGSQEVYNLIAYLSLVERTLEHCMALSCASIQKYQFNWQIPSKVMHDLHDLEEEWKKERVRFISQSEVSKKVETLIEFPNGWAWFDLQEDGCRAEADAMGHCATGGREGDINFSLREPIVIQGEKGWRPHLTFIYNERTMYLGERKGFANNKPGKEYHQYIVPLLRLGIIEGMDYIPMGGYKPENNFQLSDLDEALQEMLVKEKPGLAPPFYLVKKYGVNEKSVAFAKESLEKIGINNELHTLPPDNVLANEFIVMAEYPSVNDFLKHTELVGMSVNDIRKGKSIGAKPQHAAAYALAVITGEEDIDTYYYDNEQYVDKYEIKNFLKEAHKINPNYVLSLGKFLKDEYEREEDYLDDYNFEDPKSIGEYIKNHENVSDACDEMIKAIRFARSDGYRDGIEAQMLKSLESWIEDFKYVGAQMHLMGKKFFLDEKCAFLIKATDIEGILNSEDYGQDELDLTARGIAMSIDARRLFPEFYEPRYGWDGYDETTAFNQFADYHLPEALHSIGAL